VKGWLVLLVFAAGCSGRPPQQSGALGVFNPRGLEERMNYRTRSSGRDNIRSTTSGTRSGSTPRQYTVQ
jgi:hypothetical protein